MTRPQIVPESPPSTLEQSHVRIAEDGRPVLHGALCKDCDTPFFPPTDPCPACGGSDIVGQDMPRQGTVYSETTVFVAPKQWNTPYQLGYVDLQNGARVLSHLTGAPQIGDTVSLATGVVGQTDDGTPYETFVFTGREG